MQGNNYYGQMQHFLHLITGIIADWLNNALSVRGDHWWDEAVYQHLSFSPQQNINRTQQTDLRKLDFAALLRVLDGNWFFLSENYAWDRTVRNYIKEAQNIRNKWAHCNTLGYNDGDIYRDCDTFERLLAALNPECPLCAELAQFKTELIKQTLPSESVAPESELTLEKPDSPQSSLFEIGNMVAPKSTPQKMGVILEKKVQSPENRYRVFIDGRKSIYYESQLIPVENDNKIELKSTQAVSCALTSSLLAHPSTEFLYSLNSAKIDFVPYQFRPVLKLIRSERPRLLIADSVGVGKTIEAGLIMRELQVRNSAEKILIICPKPLVAERKWEQEMRRFDEDFFSLDGASLKYCIRECNRDGFWPTRYQKCIIPYSLLNDVTLNGDRKNCGLVQLDPPPQWDLVIVDEAHHIRNNNTQAYENVRYFCDNAEAVVFLTATPIQMGNQDLFNLLNLIRPDLILDQASFSHLLEPNQFINAAISEVRVNASGWAERTAEFLRSAAQTTWGQNVLCKNPGYSEVLTLLKTKNISPENRIKILSTIEDFHTLSGIINRTRRRDIGNFTIRNPQTVEVTFSADQQAVYDDLLKFEATALKMLHGNVNITFLMSTLKRQAASSIYAIAPFLDDILNRRIQMMEEFACESGRDTEFNFDVFDQLTADAQDLKARALQMQSPDEKLNSLIKIVKEKQLCNNNKVMVFSSFRHTLAYLSEQLKKIGIKTAVIHGGVPDSERNGIRQKFELSKENADSVDVLLFSEVGCEGLDYQFCDIMINYDLPWNPMRIEQRIGRIDRRGQKSEKVLIYNLITSGTIDASIYYRCLSRIGVFEHSIGECDAILGEIQHKLESIANNQRLSEQEREEKLQQLADNELRNMQEQQRIEDAAYEFFGLSVPKYYSDELEGADNYWLRAEQIKTLVEEYLKTLFDLENSDIFCGNAPVFTLKINAMQKEKLLDEYRSMHFPKKTVCRELEHFLKSDLSSCTVTFDGVYATNHPETIFIAPIHPLVIMAVKNIQVADPIHTALAVYSDTIPSGTYPFIIYEWEYLGMKPGVKLVPIIDSAIASKDFFDLIMTAIFDNDCESYPEQEEFDALDSIHQTYWETSLEEYKKQAKQIYDFKKSSLFASYQARIALAREQLNKSNNERIKIMREAQCRNIEKDYQLRLKKFDDALSALDIRMIPLVYGQIEVKG